jgi:hypothetical protein
MKQFRFIILSALLVLILAVVWVYVLFFRDTTTDGGIFTDLWLGNTDTPTVVEPTAPDPDPVVNVADPEPLRQLTTEPVAGFQDIRRATTSSAMVYYVAAGEGNVFSSELT